ncbi:MAG: phospholipase D-like domain-containing protein [Bacteroidales bacterium]|nr:phospholipase D-like domain-containing protein [Bacteroidales bacterium]
MTSNVLFSKIKAEIITNLYKASKEIKVAVAWLTDEDIIWALTKRKEAGIEVKIAISDSKENFKNNNKFKEFLRHEGELYVSTTVFLHHKFCIIDDNIIINGSYNWSYTAIKNEENIMVTNLDNSIKEDSLLLEKFNVKFRFLCSKCSIPVTDMNILNSFRDKSRNMAVVLAELDEKEILLRQQFEDDVRRAFDEAKAEKIAISQLVLDIMMADGGGVDSVRRLLNDEISSGEMKSGFKRLEEHIPHRVDLSFEYLVSKPKYSSLFSPDIVEFCKKLMKKYGL